MIVYHGSSLVVEKPDIQHSFRPLDFGKGFYVTSVKEQAARWASRKSLLTPGSQAIINIYQIERALKEIKAYPTYDQISFVTQAALDSLLSFSHIEIV